MEQPGAMGGAPQGGAPQQQGQPGGGGMPPEQGGGDPAAQLQQMAQQYVQQGRPPELATQIADALVGAMGLDAAPAGGGPGGPAGPGGDPAAAGPAAGGPSGMMARGGNMNKFTSKKNKGTQTPPPARVVTTGRPTLDIPGHPGK